MNKLKLIRGLAELSKPEINRFESFLASPYFNTNEKLITLFRVLKKFHPKYNCTREKIFTLAFSSEKAFEDSDLRRHFNMLNNLLKKFIVTEKVHDSSFNTKLFLLQFFRERNLNKEFATHYLSIQQFIETQKTTNLIQLQRYSIEYERYLFEEQNDPKALDDFYEQITKNKIDRDALILSHKEAPYNRILSELEKFTIFQKLIFSCLLLNWAKEYEIDQNYNLEPIYELIVQIPDTFLNDDIVFQIWLSAAKLLQNPSKKTYTTLYQYIKKEYLNLGTSDIRTLCAYLQNNLKRIDEPGSQTYFRQLFELYILQEEIGVFQYRLDTFIFRNIVTVSLVIHEFNWLHSFLEQYKQKLSTFKDGSYVFSKARVDLAELLINPDKDSPKLQELFYRLSNIVEHQLDSIFDKLLNRQLQLKICYEIGDEDLFHALYNSFSTFISRNEKKLTEIDPRQRHIIGNRNYLSFLQKLFKLKMDFLSKVDKEIELNKLEITIDTTSLVASRFYLQKQLVVLKGNG